MESFDRVPDEFDTNLELLKIAYMVYYRELNRDTIIYSCKSSHVIPMSPLSKNTKRQIKG
jgi:hypothetical protein